MDLLLHFFEHALEDTLALVPFLFVTYMPRAPVRTRWFAVRALPDRLSARCWAWSRSVAFRPWRPRSTPVAW